MRKIAKDAAGPHHHRSRTRSSSSSPTTWRRSRSARSAPTRPSFARRAAQRHAPGSGRDHGRRDARPRDDGDGDHRRRDRSPGLLDAAHQQRRPRPSTASSTPFRGSQQKQIRQQLVAGAQGRDLDEAGRAAGRRGSGRRRSRSCAAARASSELIEAGETEAAARRDRGSVAYYRMQSMNQSLLSLLVHGVITYQEAMRQSPDPEDLSLQAPQDVPADRRTGRRHEPVTGGFLADPRAAAVSASCTRSRRRRTSCASARRTS